MAGVDGDDRTTASERFTLLQTPEFITELHRRLDGARHRILIQLMTFDGDDAGQGVAERLLAAADRGVKVEVLVDCFALRFVSDQPVSRPAVRDEAAASLAMYERLRDGGVDLTFTHPNGPGLLFALARNHKKLFVIDDDVYLGGINVSDHNFSWHDFMIRIDDEEIRHAVVEDFEFTRAGGRRSVDGPIITNQELEGTFNRLLAEARHSIVLASPYAIDVGLTRLLAKVTAPDVRVITTSRNNFLVYRRMSPYLRWRLRRAGVQVDSYTNFSHSKFLLIDDERLLIGSSNFGRHSFWCNEEICLLITDPDFIARFKAELLGDTEPVGGRLHPIDVAFGGLVSWVMYGCIIGLRHTVASRVPNLSRR
ncbi:MAG: phosphatidylserine/phosphatidylglycerophosphate/cardiolipin synthase family protein [Actinomycetota bacterium]